MHRLSSKSGAGHALNACAPCTFLQVWLIFKYGPESPIAVNEGMVWTVWLWIEAAPRKKACVFCQGSLDIYILWWVLFALLTRRREREGVGSAGYPDGTPVMIDWWIEKRYKIVYTKKHLIALTACWHLRFCISSSKVDLLFVLILSDFQGQYQENQLHEINSE